MEDALVSEAEGACTPRAKWRATKVDEIGRGLAYQGIPD